MRYPDHNISTKIKLCDFLKVSPTNYCDSAYNVTKFTRKMIIEEIAIQLRRNPEIFSFSFEKQGDRANILITYYDKSMISVRVYFFYIKFIRNLFQIFN